MVPHIRITANVNLINLINLIAVQAARCLRHRCWRTFGEQLSAYASVAEDVHGVLLPLLLEECELTMHVQSLVKLDFRDPSRAQWDTEVDRLRVYLDRPAAAEADLPCPYPGMRPFTEDDAGRFFGRKLKLDNIIYLSAASGGARDLCHWPLRASRR